VPTLKVPENVRPNVSRIAELSEAEFSDVKKALTGLPHHPNPDALMKMAQKIDTSVPDLSDILQTVMSLGIGRLKAEIPPEEFVSGVSKSIKLDAAKKLILEQRLRELLEVDSTAVSARAFDIQHEYEKVLTAARVLTDMRPIFNTAGTEVSGGMVVHNLSIGYFEDGRYKETVFAMDDDDILALKKVIERAENKSATLARLIEKAGVEYLDSREH
jgi:hypothetical protein